MERIKNQRYLILVLMLYLFFSVILFSHYQYIINPDGISYISIAQNYVNGHISYAINGYWSPLYSWLLIPFILLWKVNLGNIIATKILAIIIGLFTLIAIYLILIKLHLNNYLNTVILLAFIPIMLYFTFQFITPDLLVACLLLYYLNFLMDEKYRKKEYMGLLTGFFGVLAFLAKSYVFFFFLIHFIFTNLFYVKNFPLDKGNIKKNLLWGLSIFLVISGIWVGVISEKYGVITIGTTGSYNYELVGPESDGHAMFYKGLITPPNEFSVSAWEDPSYFQLKKWNPLESTENFIHQIMIILNNFYNIVLISLYLLFVPFFSILLALFLFFKSNEKSIKNNVIFILGTIILYIGGYILIIVEGRYLWFSLILSFILGFYSLNELYNQNDIKLNFFRASIIIMVAALVFYPLLFFMYYNPSLGYYETSLALKSHGIEGNIASNDQWEIMDYLSYYLDSRFYGVTTHQSDSELKETLNFYQIDYYFVWGESGEYSSKGFIGELVYKNQYFEVFKVNNSY
jgi:hypothetical protein